MNLAELRRDYEAGALHRRDLDPDPIRQFQRWLNDAIAIGQLEPTAMTLATATPDGRPSARVVLLKAVEPSGFVFFTNYRSQKGREIEANPNVELCFFWDKLERTVRVHGSATRRSREESESYFRQRPRRSQIGAAASNQSEVVASREVLEQRFAELEKQYENADVPTPPHWGGFRVTPEAIELWQGRASRLHDRLRYRRDAHGAWVIERIAP
ncbi:MAG TPA: pyridoxamine 5'-phosphate oxidase [Tepidisphaeraceae bacterium]|nr:pyridoxamine 5'-phosphate oxidase [Tepidisphaeraceae bacterium]